MDWEYFDLTELARLRKVKRLEIEGRFGLLEGTIFVNAITGLISALFLLAGTGYAMDKLYVEVRRAALIKASQGLPSLSAYTRQLTCKEIAKSGALVAYKKGSCSSRAHRSERR